MSAHIERMVYVREGHEQSDVCAQMAAHLKSMNVDISIENIDIMKQEYRARGIPMPEWLTPGVARIPMLAEVHPAENIPILTAGLAAIKRIRAIAEEAMKSGRTSKARRVLKDGEKYTGGGELQRPQPMLTGPNPVHPGSVSPSSSVSSGQPSAALPQQFSSTVVPSTSSNDPPPMVRQCKRQVMAPGEKYNGD